jgi:sugar-specific transcriptional regulator TrmB
VSAIDLTPFGFTPTENLAYRALIEQGPSSGYAVSRHIGVARANAYQALDGLILKGAAVLAAQNPKQYRATVPGALFARILDAQAQRLDRLEEQLTAEPGTGEPVLVELVGIRAVRDLATRAILRASAPVRCVAPGGELEALAPAIRARAAAGRPTDVWPIGAVPSSLAIQPAGTIPESRALALFGQAPLLLLGDGALAAVVRPSGASGIWCAAPLVVGLVRGAVDALTA